MTPNTAASVRARLLNQAKERQEEFGLFLVRFAVERFLYRLGASRFRERCVLKGAALLTLWMQDPYRASRDIDLLASGPDDAAAVREIVTEVCGILCPEDGLRFDLDSLVIDPIREAEKYRGQRAVLWAFLEKTKIRVQVDFGFGDVLTQGVEEVSYPTLLEALPAPRLRTYPRVTSTAEKFQAMVDLGRRNSRMKDFHDLWSLSGGFAFDGTALRTAVAACFERRGTAWTPEVPDALTPSFYADAALQGLWEAYRRSGAPRVMPPAAFPEVGERLRTFLLPVRDSIVAGSPFTATWEAGGPWR